MKEMPITEEQREKFYAVNADNAQVRTFSLNGQEVIEYRPDTAIRIWFNDLDAGFDSHRHMALEIIQPITGWYDITIDTTDYHINPGDILIVPSMALHSITAPDEGQRFIYLFDMSSISSIHGFAAAQSVIDQPVLITRKDYPFIYEEILQILSDMRNEYFEQNEFAELSIFSLLLKLLVKLGTNRLESLNLFDGMRIYKQKEYMTKFSDVIEYIDSHYTEDLKLEHIAASIGFSKYHFSRLFKQYTNYTFCNYLCRRRIKAAKELLVQPDMSITEIALQTGFPSISTFNRAFKQLTNCTPSEYRAHPSMYA